MSESTANSGLRVAIRKQADANTVEVANAVLAEIERINQDFPQVTLVQVINQGSFIERSIRNVATSVFYGGALAVLVLIFFLRSIRSTVVIALSIPISVIATFLLIHSAGSTLNLMTLGGLALGVGMMVDSSIVVLENIYRRRNEYGELPKEASVAGAVEVGPAILASTLTTLVIFLPVVFMAGVSGMLFSELAYVIAFSLICSLVVSLSLVPMLTSKLLRPKQETTNAGVGSSILALAERAFVATEDAYKDLLGVVLKQRLLTIAVTIAMLVGSLMLVPKLGREFMPPSDEGEVRVSGEMEVGTRLDVVDRQLRIMERIVAENVPELVSYVGSAGANEWNPNAGTTGEIRLSLTPAAERQRSNEQVAAELRRLLAGQLPGMTLRVRAPQGQFLLERILGGDGGLAVEIRGHDLEVMRLLTERAIDAMSNIEGVTNIQTSQTDGKPQEMLQIDRAKAADMGVSVRDVTQAIETPSPADKPESTATAASLTEYSSSSKTHSDSRSPTSSISLSATRPARTYPCETSSQPSPGSARQSSSARTSSGSSPSPPMLSIATSARSQTRSRQRSRAYRAPPATSSSWPATSKNSAKQRSS